MGVQLKTGGKMRPTTMIFMMCLVSLLSFTGGAKAEGNSPYERLDELFTSSKAVTPTIETLKTGSFESYCYLRTEPTKKDTTTWHVEVTVVDHGPLLGEEKQVRVAFGSIWADVIFANGYAVAYHSGDDKMWTFDIKLYENYYIIKTLVDDKDWDYCYAF
jgi:hypothetical protein